MKYYMAPLEGITIYIYRSAYNQCFGDIDKYFTPFIAAEGSLKMKTKEIRDILPENNQDMNLVPQIISNNSNNFIRFARLIQDRGYDEININLGCPSGTVVSKYKGSGFLAKPDELNRFLDQIYSELHDMKISVKTRIGLTSPEEIYKLTDIYNNYPIHELIIHPRVRTDFYKNEPRMEYFRYAYENSRNPVCYNGDINTVSDYNRLISEYPDLRCVMLGRGIIHNPGLVGGIRNETESLPDIETLRLFHDLIYNEYKQIVSGEKNVLFKMKEIWTYMLDIFTDNSNNGKLLKKAASLAEYNVFVNRIFSEGY